MKINHLSRISGVNPETIRMYRNQGLLKPVQLPNGYYDYSMDDLRSLLHIRKLRGAGLGLENIRFMNENANPENLYVELQREYDELNAQIEELQRQQFMLKLTMDHFGLYRDQRESIVELTVDDDSYSVFYTERDTYDAVEWMKQMNLMTQSIRIDPAALLASPLPEELPMSIGIGTYMDVIERNNIAVPDSAVLIPKGRYLTMWLTPENDRSVSREQIMPLISYARAHNYRLTGDNTAFMYRVDTNGGNTKFIYRFRARYE